MYKVRGSLVSLAFCSMALMSACADSTAPSAASFDVTPLASHVGGPDLTDFRMFAGQLWVCPDTKKATAGFLYRWSIVDNATNQVVQQGVRSNVTSGTCLMLAAVPTSPRGHYTATVREDAGAKYKISSIVASYGGNLPIVAPTATVNANGKMITDQLSSDYGVVFTFYH